MCGVFLRKEVRTIAEIDSLEIRISASAEQANKAIRHLTRSLGALSSSLKIDTSSLEKLNNLNGDNFKKLGEGIEDLSVGMKELKNVRTSDFNALAKGIKKLSAIPTGNLQTVASALTPLADGIRTLSSANFDNRNLQNLINSLTRLSNANVGSLASVDFTTLGNNIKGLATALSGADKVEQNTISMTNAIAKLAGAGANIGTVTTELPRLGTALKDFMNTMSSAPILASETIAFTQAIGQLASAGSKAETVANSLGHLGNELKQFMQTMASVPNVSANVIQMTQALAQLANAGGGTGRAASSLGNAFNGINTSTIRLIPNIGRFSVSIKGLGAQISKTVNNVKTLGRQLLGAMGIVGGVYGAVRAVKKSIENSMNYIETLNYFERAFEQVASKADLSAFSEMGYKSAEEYFNSFSERAKEVTAKMSGFNIGEDGTLIASGIPSLGLDPDKLMNYQAMFGQISSSMGVASETSLKLSQALTEIGADLASVKNMNFDKVWQDMASGFVGMSRTLDKYGANIRNVNLQQKLNELGIKANVNSLNQNDKALLRTIILLDSTKYAWGDLANTLNQPSNQLRLIQGNIQNLSRTIGNLFLPIVAKILPYINGFVIALQRLFAWLGKIFKIKLDDLMPKGGGGDSGVISDLIGGAGELEDGLNAATAAAKKLNKQVRAFDELNVINTSSGGAGGAGAEGIGGGLLDEAFDKAFEEYQAAWDEAFANVEDKASEIANKIEKALEPIKKIIQDFVNGDFKQAGEDIGKLFSDILKNIKWKEVYQAADNFGIGLAELLNGLISPELFSDLGTTVAGSINTVLHGLDSFGETFEWNEFGGSLAAGLNSFMNELDWETALSASSEWGDGIGDALNKFLEDADFEEIGATIVKLINTVLTGFNSFAKRLKWGELGKSLASSITGFFKNWDAELTGETLGNFASGLLEAATEALSKLGEDNTFEILGQKIVDFICGIDWGELAWDLAKFFDALAKAAYKFPADLAKGIAKSIAGKITGADIGEIEVPEWLERLPEFFFANPSQKIKMTFDFVSNFEEWSGNIKNFWDENISPKFSEEKWQEFGQNIKSALKGKWEDFSGWWETTGISNWWNDVTPWFSEEKWNFNGIKEGLKSAWDSAIDAVKSTWNNFAKWINEKLTWTIDPITIAGKTIFEGTTINLGKMPMLATGAVFRGGNPFMAIVNDQPRGQTNIEAPLKVIKQALREELTSLIDKFNNVQLTPTFKAGQFQPAPPPEFDFERRCQNSYWREEERQRRESNYDGFDGELSSDIERKLYDIIYSATRAANKNSQSSFDNEKQIRLQVDLDGDKLYDKIYKINGRRHQNNSNCFAPENFRGYYSPASWIR